MPAPDKRGKSKPRPLGRPRPAKGAARRKKTTPAATTSSLAQRAIAQRPTGRPAPAFGAARLPKTRAALYQKYGLVFDPAGEDNPVTQAELDSLLELYRRSTGGELDTQSDVRRALEDAGLIGKPERRLTKPVEDLYASAMDALDAFDREVGPYVSDQAILGGASRAIGRAAREVADFPVPIPRPGGLFPRASSSGRVGAAPTEQTTVGDVAGPVVGAAAAGLGEAAKTVVRAPSIIPNLGGLRLQTTPTGQVEAPRQERRTFLQDLGRAAEIAITEPPSRIADLSTPIPSLGGLRVQASSSGQLATPTTGERPTISETWLAAQAPSAFGGMGQDE